MNFIKINRRSGILTISSVFLLLIAGGVVRSTGSGMGCPDWPKCYGSWFPPACSCELPADYKEIYVQQRLKKTERFAKILHFFGLHKQVEILYSDPKLYLPEEFNTQKAWTEYINRLIGVLAGLFSLVYFISLFGIRHHVSKFKFWTGIAGFFMMIFNAWLGGIVVATNLFPVIISIHYLAAYAVIALLMFSLVNARIDETNRKLLPFKFFFLFYVFLSLVQVVFGTRLREISETALTQGKLYNGSNVNFETLGMVFNLHWYLAIGLIILSFIPVLILNKKIQKTWFRLLMILPLTLIVQYFSGVLNLRYGFPLAPQVSHIFFAGIIFALTLYICIAIFRAPRTSQNH